MPRLCQGLLVAILQNSQPSADGIGGHDSRQEGRRQQLQGVDIPLLEQDVVAVPVGRVKVHLNATAGGGGGTAGLEAMEYRMQAIKKQEGDGVYSLPAPVSRRRPAGGGGGVISYMDMVARP